MKCPNRSYDFEGTPDEINDHLNFGPDRRQEAEAHGFMITEPCEECGNRVTGRDRISHRHAETCSRHPRNVPRPPGVHFVEGGVGADGGTLIDGVAYRPGLN